MVCVSAGICDGSPSTDVLVIIIIIITSTYPSYGRYQSLSCIFLKVYLQNLRSNCLLFPAPSGALSGGRHPLGKKHAFPSTLCHVVSEHIWLGWSISKTLGLVACFFLHLQEHPHEGSTL